MTPRKKLNQKHERRVRTCPLSGMPSAMTTSKAERRSVATTKSRSPETSYTSRTLPREKSFTPANCVSRRGGCSVSLSTELFGALILSYRWKMSTKKMDDIFSLAHGEQCHEDPMREIHSFTFGEAD